MTKWVEDKGFGFINLQGKSLFVHARELIQPTAPAAATGVLRTSKMSGGVARLAEGQQVEFTIGSQPDGRLKATLVSAAGGGVLPCFAMSEEQGQQPSKPSSAPLPEGKATTRRPSAAAVEDAASAPRSSAASGTDVKKSSSQRPLWDTEDLIRWPSEFASREMDFFDLEELEEKERRQRHGAP